ncbi:MAG: hypothetical protein ACXAES_14435 [Promethearchaeota archaeon]|jgi:hypothetical protein
MDNISNLTIEDTSWSKIPKVLMYFFIGVFIYANIILPYLIICIFPSLFNGSLYLPDLVGVLIVMNLPTLAFIIKIISMVTPLQKTKICILDTELKIFLQNSLFSRILLNELETVELIKIRKNNIALNFKKPNFERRLLIILFLFKKKKQDLLADYLKEASEKFGIHFFESVVKTVDSHEIKEFSMEIKNFIKKKKKE